jgi:hypothetical protein
MKRTYSSVVDGGMMHEQSEALHHLAKFTPVTCLSSATKQQQQMSGHALEKAANGSTSTTRAALLEMLRVIKTINTVNAVANNMATTSSALPVSIAA